MVRGAPRGTAARAREYRLGAGPEGGCPGLVNWKFRSKAMVKPPFSHLNSKFKVRLVHNQCSVRAHISIGRLVHNPQ